MSLNAFLEKYTMAQLRAELNEQGISAARSAKKGDLVELLSEQLDSETPVNPKMASDVEVFRKATRRRKFLTWAKLPEVAVLKYLTVIRDDSMGLDPRKELIYRAAKFDLLAGFQGELSNLLALLLYSNQELDRILTDNDIVPEQSVYEKIYQILKEGIEPYRSFYPLETFSTLTRGDWDALKTLFGENPLEAMIEAELMDPLPMELSMTDISNLKFLELVKYAQSIQFTGTAEDLKRICPRSQKIELQRYLGGRDREENTVTNIFHMSLHTVVDQLTRMEVNCNTDMLERGLRTALIYAVATPHLVPRTPKRRSKFTEMNHAFRLAVEGVLTDFDKIMIPAGTDRTLVEQELQNLAMYENLITISEYSMLRTLDDSSIRFGLNLFHLPSVSQLSRPLLLFILVHRQLPPGTDLDGLEDRYNRVADLLSVERAALMMLHRTTDMSTIMNAPETELDNMIYRVVKWRRQNQRKKILDFAERKGVLLPTSLYEGTNWNAQYTFILSDFIQYRPILNRSRKGPWTLEEQTDIELVENYGVIPVYRTREELLMGYRREGPQLWIPIDVSKAKNTETPLYLTDLENDMEDYLYAEGPLDDFRVITADELRDCIQESHGYSIPSPFRNQERAWSMRDLLSIAREHNDRETIVLLSNRLNTEIDFNPDDFTSDQRTSLIQIFRKMIDLGMYMRRWGGPGTPYPLAADETTSTHLGYEIGIAETFNELDHLLAESRLRERFERLRMRRALYNDYTLGYILNGVRPRGGQPGHFCIRMASGYLTKSGIEYLSLLGQEFIDPVRQRPIRIDEIESVM